MSPLRKRLLLGLAAVLLFCGGVAVGRFGRSSSTSIQESATLDESAGLDLQRHEVVETKPTTKVVTRIVYRDGPVQERVVEREVAAGSTTTTDTAERATVVTHETVKEVVKVDDRPFRAGVIFAVTPGHGTQYGAYAGVRIVGPLEASAVVLGGPVWTAGLGIGVRF